MTKKRQQRTKRAQSNEFVGNIGDVNWVEHDGSLIFNTPYGAEIVNVRNDEDWKEDWDEDPTWTINSVDIPKVSPEEAKTEWYYDSLGSVGSYIGQSSEELISGLGSDDLFIRAQAYESIAGYHGWENLGSSDVSLGPLEMIERFKGVDGADEALQFLPTPMIVLDNMNDDGSVTVTVSGPGAAAWAANEQSIEGSNWESDSEDFAYAILADSPDLLDDLGREFDSDKIDDSQYSPPEEEDEDMPYEAKRKSKRSRKNKKAHGLWSAEADQNGKVIVNRTQAEREDLEEFEYAQAVVASAWGTFGAMLADQAQFTTIPQSIQYRFNVVAKTLQDSGEKSPRVLAWEELASAFGEDKVKEAREFVAHGMQTRQASKYFNVPFILAADLLEDAEIIGKKAMKELVDACKATLKGKKAASRQVLASYGKVGQKVLGLMKAGNHKLAVDQSAEDYWTNYYGEYGEQLVKEVKKRVKADLARIWLVKEGVDQAAAEYWQNYFAENDYGKALTEDIPKRLRPASKVAEEDSEDDNVAAKDKKDKEDKKYDKKSKEAQEQFNGGQEMGGQYIDIVPSGAGIKIIPDVQALQEGEPRDLYEMFDDVIANNDAEWMNPEDIGALTDGAILRVWDKLYWDSEDAVRDTFAELMQGNSVDWIDGGELEDEEMNTLYQ